MTKARKRFISALIAFTSIVSFVPVEFGVKGTEAYAAADIASATKVSVTQGANGTTGISGSGNLFSTKTQIPKLYLVVPNKIVAEDKIKLNETEIIEQEIIIKKINGISLDKTVSSGNVGNIKNIDLNIKKADLPNEKQLGVMIENLPLGVNKIEYTIRIKTATRVLTGNLTADGKEESIVQANPEQTGEYPTLTIEHGNEIVQNQIHSIDFTNYVEERVTEDDLKDEDKNINIAPFIYKKTVQTTSDSSLRYINDVAVSVKALDYTIKVSNSLFNGDNTTNNGQNSNTIYVNGEKGESLKVGTSEDGKYGTITGSLEKTGISTMVVLAIRSADSIKRSFSIEIQNNNKNTQDDYALKEAGITKYNYNADPAVKAQIGKVFIETTGTGDEKGIPIYSGTIKVDSKAKMIAMEPIISRSSDTTAYKIYNYYDGGSEPGQLKNGKMYVNFNKGTNNVVTLEIYEGKDGSVTGKKLAVYKFHVEIIGEETSEVQLGFENNEVYLTQPGRTDKYEFSSSRRSYDLHSNNNIIKFNLKNPVGNGEYIKAWTSSSVGSGNLKSVEVKRDENNSQSFTIDVQEAKKLVVQVYYDEVTYKQDGVTVESKTPYPIGDKYTFYIAKNAGIEDNDNGGIESSNAELTDIKVKGAAIKPAEGNTTGFSKDKNNYEATVSKTAKEANVTVTAADEKVKDISVKVVETGDEYGLDSGKGFDFPLNSSGKTTLEIVVTAQDGTTKKSYTLTINNDTRNASATLKNVVLSTGDLIFDPSKKVNTGRVDLKVKKVNVTPVVDGAGSVVTVNGTKFTGSPISIDLSGEQKTEVKIEVTSEDGSESKTYRIDIYRTDSIIEDITGEGENDKSDIFYDEIEKCWVDISKYKEWGKVNGKSVYFNAKGRQVKNEWVNTDGKWYYLNSSGYKASGWKVETDGKTYYLDPVTGEMRKEWLNINGKTYYLNLNGVMQKNWLYLNNKWYYFTQNGQMVVNQTMSIEGKMYTFGQDGAIR